MVNAPVLSRMTVDLDDYLQRYTWQETEGKWFSVYRVPGTGATGTAGADQTETVTTAAPSLSARA